MRRVTDEGELWERACDDVRADLRRRGQSIGGLTDDTTLDDVPVNDADFWDRVEVRVEELRAGRMG